MEGVNSEGVDVPDAGGLHRDRLEANNDRRPKGSREHTDFDAELEPLAIEPIGRPTRDFDWETRQIMIGLFHLVGPGIGLACLRAFFPDAAKGKLEYMLARYRRVHLRRNKVVLHVLRWHKPGSVWAIDFHNRLARSPTADRYQPDRHSQARARPSVRPVPWRAHNARSNTVQAKIQFGSQSPPNFAVLVRCR